MREEKYSRYNSLAVCGKKKAADITLSPYAGRKIQPV
jgi:hypothetical protein